MPISKFNDDGTVDIYNSKTGEVRTGIRPEQLGTISPRLVAEYQVGQSPENVLSRKETEIALKEIEKPSPTETQKGQVSSAQTLASDLKLLEEQRQAVSPTVRGKGLKFPSGTAEKPGGFLGIGNITRAFEPDIAAFEGLRETTSFTLASALAGQTGRALSDEERKGLKKGLPEIKDTDAEAQRKLTNLTKQVESRLIQAGKSPEEAKVFSQSLLSELGLEEADKSEIGAEAVDVATKKKSIGEFGQNILNDIQTNIEGLVNIPSALKQASMEVAEEGPSLFGPGIDFIRTPTGKAMMQGVVDEYKNLITHPLEHAYEHPVNTILDVVPFLAGAKKLTAGKVGKATKTVSLTDEAVRTVTGVTDELAAVEKAIPEEAVAQATRRFGVLPSRAEIGAKTYSSAFIVPTKRAKNLRPVETSAKMLDYGISGSLDDMNNIASKVTGDTGVLTKVTRDSIGNIKGEIPMGKAVQSAQNMLKDVIELTPIEENRILNNIVRAERVGEQPLMMNALEAYDTAKRLEALGHQQLNTSTYLTKNVKAEGIGKAYLAAADEIMSDIEGIAGQQNVLQGFKTPEIQAQLSEVSPKLANEFMQANTLKDVRSLQAPFVRLNQMIDLTEQAGNTAFQSAGRQVGGGIGRSVVGGIAGSPFGPLGIIAGAVAGQLIGPPIEAAIEAMRPSILTKTAKFISGAR